MGQRQGRERRRDPVRTKAQVVARWQDHRVLLRLAEGVTLPALVPAPIRDRYDVGDSAWVELAPDGSVAEWGLATG